MQNDGIGRGSALGGVDAGHGLGVQAIGPQPVDRLCGKGHQAACSENRRGFADGRIVHRVDG